MKIYLFLILSLSFCAGFAQKNYGFNEIDNRVQSIEPATAADLALILTAPYNNETKKVRAIFSWIAQHIEYKTKYTITKNFVSPENISLIKSFDFAANYSANEYVAESVLKNKSGVCEGYARLFKTLCDYAGIKSALVTGYARSNLNTIGKQFFSNHYWNAVYADSAWHLVDVTWASGYFTFHENEFIKYFDDQYFFTPPDLFIRDHFPDDLEWTLLAAPTAPEEFINSPFKQRSFTKYNIESVYPKTGFINVNIGDSINLELETSDIEADKKKAIDTASLDSSMLLKYSSVAFLQPVISGNKITYVFTVNSPDIEWLHLMYNKDVILRYKLKIKK
jgi:transglutaminase/protease-like cytokinesis protein 3